MSPKFGLLRREQKSSSKTALVIEDHLAK